jgi:hypothetical protein
MKHKIKVAMVVAAALLVLTLAVSLFVPVVELHGKDCLYCGEESNTVRILGVKVWQFRRGSSFRDGLTMPEHTHRMTDICGSRIWVFRSDEHWDTFGWAARSYRDALVAGVAACPERRAAILAQYLEIDPSDKELQDRFIKTYRTQKTEQVVPSDGHNPSSRVPLDGSTAPADAH